MKREPLSSHYVKGMQQLMYAWTVSIGMPLDHRPPKIVTQRGHKKVRYRTAGNKSQITIIGCVSATGHAVPPFVIWDAKSMNKEWSVGEVPGTTSVSLTMCPQSNCPKHNKEDKSSFKRTR